MLQVGRRQEFAIVSKYEVCLAHLVIAAPGQASDSILWLLLHACTAAGGLAHSLASDAASQQHSSLWAHICVKESPGRGARAALLGLTGFLGASPFPSGCWLRRARLQPKGTASLSFQPLPTWKKL